MEFLTYGLVWYVNLLLAFTVHEAAHAYAALLGGDRTAYGGGQVTLDPRPHVRREPMGTIIFPIISFIVTGGQDPKSGWMMGWASAPYDFFWARQNPRRAALMALAGPLGNLALAGLAGILLKLGLLAGLFNHAGMSISFVGIVEGTSQTTSSLVLVLSVMFSLNVILFIFNLIPVPPLDGAAGITILMSGNAARRFQEFMVQPFFQLIGLIIAWKISGYVIWYVFAWLRLALFVPGSP